jgi:hypothetical protein
MFYIINSVEFDFDDDLEFTDHHYDNVTGFTLETMWEADDGDDLIEQITNCTGWCIKSIAYEVV